MLQEIANSSSRFTLQLPHSSSSLPSPTLLTHAAAQSLHTCTTPVPWRAPSSPAISLFQRNPYPPGAEELRYLECKRAIFPYLLEQPQALSSVSQYEERETFTKHYQSKQTNKKKGSTSLCRPKPRQEHRNILQTHCPSITWSKQCCCC